MFRLGLRLAVRGGREALIRLIVTALAVMVGAALLLSVLAVFHGYQVAGSKPCFVVSDADCKPATAASNSSQAAFALYRKDAYKGKIITRLDVAKISDYTVTIPGLAHQPKEGEYYASPAMAALLKQAPANELSDRYPGVQVGTIGAAGLHGPDELVIIIGRKAADISSLPGVVRIASIGMQKADGGNTAFVQFAAGLGAVALLFPMLILVGSATRLGAARREERYAAFRLVGATPGQINVIASADALLGAALGVVAGIGAFFALQPLLADLTLTGSRFFATDVRPTAWELALIAVGVPLSAVVASFLSLRRVKISPLGVSRKITPPAPRASRLWPLGLGIVLFVGAVMIASSDTPPFAAVPGLVLIMVGLVAGGPWLTMQAVRMLARFMHGPSTLLAVRRLADDPRAAFRSVSGLVLVVFTTSLVAGFVPIALTQRLASESDALNTVLTVEFFPAKPLQPAEGTQLIHRLQAIPSVQVFPTYNDPSVATQNGPGPGRGARTLGPPPAVISCESLQQLAALGTCPADTPAVTIDFNTYEDVILLHHVGSVITDNSQPRNIGATTMSLRGLLVRADDATALEQARTLLAQQPVAPIGESLLTFGETRQAAQENAAKLQAIVSAAVIITLATAGSGIAIATAGGMIERRRPFTLLRLSGAPLGTLYKVVLWEAAVPLISAAVAAAVIGFGAATLAIVELAPESAHVHVQMPGLPYLFALAAGPVVALLVVSATLPLVGRLTKPDNIRFE